MARQDNPEEREIVEKVNYLASVFIPSINRINEAVYNLKPSRLATRLLLSDTLKAWKDEVADELETEEKTYQDAVDRQAKKLSKGTTESDKFQARKALLEAEQEYSMNVKAIIVSLLDKKIGLFATRKAIEHGELMLKDLGLPEYDDDEPWRQQIIN